MKKYSDQTVYVLGTARIGKNDPISDLYHTFFIGLIIDRDTDVIVDMTSNMIQEVTTDFIRSVIMGYRLIEEIDKITDSINNRFFGLAQKAVIAAIKDARNKYMMIVEQPGI